MSEPRKIDDPYYDLAQTLQAQHRQLRLIVFLDPPADYEKRPGIVKIAVMEVPPGEHGRDLRTTVMRQLCTLAETRGDWMAITPRAEPGIHGTEEQSHLYAQFGFVANHGDNSTLEVVHKMVRYPKP